ncbi:succinylglutamate desuccinylase/aspartoacylase family protein [Oceaniglobus trochenteri]|uniref:succinylglutamate desuccinylase/aspartoacylase family protein n=1 Tax=Oceaniglobus trochenteri TaxID=2763260 RepID=UPI001CFFFE0E|nr:succinylglutamate desuccinylase/aspartoacylase family protein [Oceaniglobus trochenteri]
MPRPGFEIGGTVVAAGERRTVELPVSVLSDHTPVTMSVQVIHGKRPGPVLFVSAAVHGDEVIGVEIARRLLRAPQLDRMAGTLLVVPIVNTFGFLNNSRYMPDRRDLNRVFPGSPTGSLAGRLAHLFMTEIVARADFGIDLHSAAIHRTNMPQIRVSASNDETLERAEAFGAPVIVRAKLREGSLRAAARAHGCDILLYEAGEALRFDEMSARVGSSGILRVMHHMGMIGAKGLPKRRAAPIQAASSSWTRAPAGGLLRCFKEVGEGVDPGTLLAIVSDPFGETEHEIAATASGIILGRAMMPVINEGDACYHIAATPIDPLKRMERLAADLEADPMFDEDEIL